MKIIKSVKTITYPESGIPLYLHTHSLQYWFFFSCTSSRAQSPTALQTLSITLSYVVTVKVHARAVVVKGPRGTLQRTFKHVTMDLRHDAEKREIKIVVWFGNKDEIACIRTVISHIQNMITGVTKVNAIALLF